MQMELNAAESSSPTRCSLSERSTPTAEKNCSEKSLADAVTTMMDCSGINSCLMTGIMISGDVMTGMLTEAATACWINEKNPQDMAIARTPSRSSC